MLKAHLLLCGEEPPPGTLSNLSVYSGFENMNRWMISANWDEGTPPFAWSYVIQGSTTIKNSGSTSSQSFYEFFTMDYIEEYSFEVSVKDATGAVLTYKGTSKG